LFLIVLAAALRPVNAGAVALVGMFAVGTFVAGEDIRTLNSGFPVDLVILLVGVTYLFGSASVNGTVKIGSPHWTISATGSSARRRED
jgi:Dicarboxylate carrier protein MatC N-terminus